MENLIIKSTKYTPSIDFDCESGKLSIVGKSYPENTFEFYKPVIEWVKEYFENALCRKTAIVLDLEYLNSSSLKAYFDLFDILEIAQEKGQDIGIHWLYDKDDDISEETGEDFIEDFQDLNMQLVIKN